MSMSALVTKWTMLYRDTLLSRLGTDVSTIPWLFVSGPTALPKIFMLQILQMTSQDDDYFRNGFESSKFSVLAR